ncbi:MAG: multidrug ABC transporter ATP-binding protein [Verrucomicrobia bacterium GWC2_42_7]|nr:MAG: multidrug ABC transporter ATP-binding protein [Verrucomicrobia bacterium GWC2_42_7]
MNLQAPIVGALYPILHSYAIKLIIDAFSVHNTLNYNELFYPALCFIGAQVMIYIAFRISDFADWMIGPGIRKDIICRAYAQLTNHSYKFFQNHLSGSLVGKISGIEEGYFHFTKGVSRHLIQFVLTTIFSGVCLVLISKNLFTILMLFCVTFIPLCLFFFRKLGKIKKESVETRHKLLGLISDKITNIFTQFAFATKVREIQHLEDYYNKHRLPLMNSWYRVDFLFMLLSPLLHWVALSWVFFCLIQLRNMGEISIGDIAFAVSTAYIFSENIVESAYVIKDCVDNYSNLKASLSIFEEPPEVIDKEKATDLKIYSGEIVFSDVSFKYEKGYNVLDHFDLRIKAGQKVGLVGRSGAGKSTVVALLLKYFKASKGDILIDNQSIYDATSDSIRSQISVIPQDTLLFHRTIAENIGYAKKDAIMNEIESAAKVANIHDFIETLPEKYNTVVGERGIKLSGGQRQRIAIARAILKNSPIFILDEGTSSLDTETEQQIQKALAATLEKSNITILAIAHRLSTIRHLGRIIVMDNGNITEDGSFEALISKKHGVFRKLWDCQLNGMII